MNARVKAPAPGEAEPVAMPVAEAAAPAAPGAAAPAKKKRSPLRLVIMLAVPVVLVAGGAYFWLTGGRYVETDNAYVQQNKISISADVAGRIATVAVSDNQLVKAGDVLFTIDPQSYEIALSQADAALATARVNVEQLRVGFATANAKLDAAKATLAIRQKEWDRASNLQQQGISAESSLDDSRLSLQQANSNVSLEEQDVASATAALGGDPNIETDDHPAVRAALAARDVAQRNLDKTTVKAPADGIVSQVGSLNVGQFINLGSTIATLVETGDIWVEANFKETQLVGLKTGMPAEVTVDAFPGVKFEGQVSSIGAATGAEFALIPAQNATGNWVKVTQRIPVNISIEGKSLGNLRAGMSAVVNVDTKPEGSVPDSAKAN
jgi:membrane fusion protein (multidrug efflux system)